MEKEDYHTSCSETTGTNMDKNKLHSYLTPNAKVDSNFKHLNNQIITFYKIINLCLWAREGILRLKTTEKEIDGTAYIKTGKLYFSKNQIPHRK